MIGNGGPGDAKHSGARIATSTAWRCERPCHGVEAFPA
jgi:hypothetical protein